MCTVPTRTPSSLYMSFIPPGARPEARKRELTRPLSARSTIQPKLRMTTPTSSGESSRTRRAPFARPPARHAQHRARRHLHAIVHQVAQERDRPHGSNQTVLRRSIGLPARPDRLGPHREEPRFLARLGLPARPAERTKRGLENQKLAV